MNTLFYNSLLIFSNENINRIKNAKISVCGIGGVGSTATEMLVRSGINNIKIADNDNYTEHNMNRQIYATIDTIGENKALVTKNRILSINPNCNIEDYPQGITLDNVYEFCCNSDIVLALNDTESIKVIIHKVAKELKIPVVMASRASLDTASRWSVRAKLWDYKDDPDLETFGTTNHPDLDKYKISEITSEILHDYDEYIKQKKIKIFKSIAHNERNNLFKTISNSELIEKLENNYDSYNRSVCSVIAGCAGTLAATLTLRYIINQKTSQLEIDLMQ